MGTAFQKMDFLTEDLGDSKEVKRTLDDILYHRKLKANQAAKLMKVAAERFYKYCNQNSANNNFPLFLLPVFTKTIGPELLMYTAHECGYAIFKKPLPDTGLKDKIREGLRASRETTEALAAYWDAIEDGKVTYAEARRSKKEILEAVEALLGILAIQEEEYQRGKS